MIKRDLEYIMLIEKSSLDTESGIRLKKDVQERMAQEQRFFDYLQPTHLCLQKYALRFSDYRLFLIDIKPLITQLTILAKRDSISADDSPVVKAAVEALTAILVQAKSALAGVNYNTDHCTTAITQLTAARLQEELTDNALPYKTIALAYLLSAIGASDTGVLELAEWIQKNSDGRRVTRNWHIIRSQIELSILLEKALPNGHRNELFYNFMGKHVDKFQMAIPLNDLREWAKPENCSKKGLNEKLLIFSYVTQVNAYIKSTPIPKMSADMVRRAEVNKILGQNLLCFRGVSAVDEQQKAWTAEFLTTYATAVLAHSYDRSIFGGSNAAEGERLRNVAKADLVLAKHVLGEFTREKQEEDVIKPKCPGGSRCSEDELKDQEVVQLARKPFVPGQWSQTRAAIESALKSISEGGN
jgi:hypothetical protein